MPTLASVTPAVPPRMIIIAGMLMNAAGLVPSILELRSSDPKATPIPIAVAAFIATHIGGCRHFVSPGGAAAQSGGCVTGKLQSSRVLSQDTRPGNTVELLAQDARPWAGPRGPRPPRDARPRGGRPAARRPLSAG